MTSTAPALASIGSDPAASESRAMTIAAMATGNILEFYDFAVYAYLASVLGHNFFPSGSDTASLLSAFAVFGVGFVIRPLGGFLIGRFGDRRGRKPALLLTIIVMANASTGLFGGFAPFIATSLVAATGAPISVAFFVAASAVISLPAVLLLKETAHGRLQ